MFRQDLALLPIFTDLNRQQLQLIEPLLKPVRFAANEVIFEQGQQAEYLYILTEGQVLVRYKPYDGPPLIVARIATGGVFGWSSALQREEYTSSAVAVGASEAFQIRGQRLQELCCQDPETGSILLDRLAGVIAERLRTTHSTIVAILGKGMDVNGDCWKDEQDER